MYLKENIFEDELLEQIKFYFRTSEHSRDYLLMESHGHVDNINMICDRILEVCYAYIEDCVTSKRDVEAHINGELPSKTAFFSSYRIDLSLHFSKTNNVTAKTRRNQSISVERDEDGIFKTLVHPHIAIEAYSDNINRFEYQIYYAIGHELTHVYNLKKYCEKYGSIFIPSNDYLATSSLYPNSEIPKMVRNVVYNLHILEQNAYTAQLYSELSHLSKQYEFFDDSKYAMNIIKQTSSYRNFYNLRDNINKLTSAGDNIRKQNDIIRAVEKYTTQKYKSYKDFCRAYTVRFEKYARKYMKIASKLVYDIHIEDLHECMF